MTRYRIDRRQDDLHSRGLWFPVVEDVKPGFIDAVLAGLRASEPESMGVHFMAVGVES
jgi:hypothetical protein